MNRLEAFAIYGFCQNFIEEWEMHDRAVKEMECFINDYIKPFMSDDDV